MYFKWSRRLAQWGVTGHVTSPATQWAIYSMYATTSEGTEVHFIDCPFATFV